MSEQQKVAQDFAMSKNSLILVLQKKQAKLWYGMAKIQIKSEKLTPFGGIFLGHGAIWLHIVFCNRLDPLNTLLLNCMFASTCNNAYVDVFQTDFG